ncbi:MAG: Asp-tRNA(Asn)/Glu-tRNA(Gln) amidotransferase subunit GatC [candidate division Zixibacteria bacterium]|nr:Asp-tRNA(Asn)/Glu-tRNA(Gln) amidotransferase subunit GatC [candidate division Zixibacteria bacterium]NIR63474.1 Asp-tRNA(Asn)/Glu-tRNA(Gln) amidotransferase subunit GatC [candidate division Zixibacteria bacterium]NIS17717.1 Asp-tRNA(Asn)/Glu-tRNA(Gln) amidotransferase subunit GatC [candidate division Zixibacteria bacterium]NIS45429.1 Asp-tRNA(Asn)/Glu-tRNA(Gln) amidotransferase subunit GatC [candidate division Zixibacteria bacterium]NIT54033.1 Asp-tRNA(Asn)/Glu-tRNA(Gln) amidotransferase sub
MTIASDEIKKLAWLARLELDEAEIGKLKTELSAILDHFQILNEVETEAIDLHQTGTGTPLRNDIPCESLSKAEALKNAPAIKDGMFNVPKVI